MRLQVAQALNYIWPPLNQCRACQAQPLSLALEEIATYRGIVFWVVIILYYTIETKFYVCCENSLVSDIENSFSSFLRFVFMTWIRIEKKTSGRPVESWNKLITRFIYLIVCIFIYFLPLFICLYFSLCICLGKDIYFLLKYNNANNIWQWREFPEPDFFFFFFCFPVNITS